MSAVNQNDFLQEFLAEYFPEGKTEYAPDCAVSESDYIIAAADHFNALAADESRLLDQAATTRFLG